MRRSHDRRFTRNRRITLIKVKIPEAVFLVDVYTPLSESLLVMSVVIFCCFLFELVISDLWRSKCTFNPPQNFSVISAFPQFKWSFWQYPRKKDRRQSLDVFCGEISAPRNIKSNPRKTFGVDYARKTFRPCFRKIGQKLKNSFRYSKQPSEGCNMHETCDVAQRYAIAQLVFNPVSNNQWRSFSTAERRVRGYLHANKVAKSEYSSETCRNWGL